jgi:hypothetical protein
MTATRQARHFDGSPKDQEFTMPKLPRLRPLKVRSTDGTNSVVFAVYAPFGSDEELSKYPNKSRMPIEQQEMVLALKKVADCGVHVSALIDLFDDDSYLVEIPAGRSSETCITSTWKQDMSSPFALAGFLRRTCAKHPRSALVLAIEGHGAGYLPDVDASKITSASVTGDGDYEWRKANALTTVVPVGGAPGLAFPSAELPFPSPELPGVRMPMSTYGLGFALKQATADGVARPAVIHFNNCLNMSLELLHTVAGHADFATAYCNSNFFTAGDPYPLVFERLRQQGTASRQELAEWFADENHAALSSKGNHPTIGCVVELSRMPGIVDRLNTLSLELVTALQTTADRPKLVGDLQDAIANSQQYDTEPPAVLEVPDQLTDVGSLAAQLSSRLAGFAAVQQAADALLKSLAGIKRYGDNDIPWVDTSTRWNFTDKSLAMNILLPDPARTGQWDWRSPYYMDGRPNPPGSAAQRFIIDILRNTGTQRPPWVQFLVEYHRNVAFKGLLPAHPPIYPIFNRDFKAPAPCHEWPDGNPSRGK